MRALVTINSAVSKRLIAKAVRKSIEKELKSSIVYVARGSTNAYIVEEILGKKIDKARYVAGFYSSYGNCVLPEKYRLEEYIFVRGKIFEGDAREIIGKMGKGDVFIKGANAIDINRRAGVLLAARDGGTIGRYYGILKARGVRFIIPASIEKLINSSIDELSMEMGIENIDLSDSLKLGIFPVSGELITELEAFKILFNVEAKAVASGSFGFESSRTFLIKGEDDNVKKAVEHVVKLKKIEDNIKPIRACKDCGYECSQRLG